MRRMHSIECGYWIWSFGIFPAVGRLWLCSSFCTFGDFFFYSGSREMSAPHSSVMVPFVLSTVTHRDPPKTSPRLDRDFLTHFPRDFLLEQKMNGPVHLKAQLPQQHLAGCKVLLLIYGRQCLRQTKSAGSLSWLTLQTLCGAQSPPQERNISCL